MILLEFLYRLSALQLSPVLYSTLPSDVRLPLTLHVRFKIKIISENIRYVKGNTQHGVVSLPILLHPLSPPATVEHHTLNKRHMFPKFFGRQLSIALSNARFKR